MELFINDLKLIREYELTKSFYLLRKAPLYVFFMLLKPLNLKEIIFESAFLNYELLQIQYVSSGVEYKLKKRILSK